MPCSSMKKKYAVYPKAPTITCQAPFLPLCQQHLGKDTDFSGEFVVLLVLDLK